MKRSMIRCLSLVMSGNDMKHKKLVLSVLLVFLLSFGSTLRNAHFDSANVFPFYLTAHAEIDLDAIASNLTLNDVKEYNGHYYGCYYFENENNTQVYDVVKAFCESIGGHLVTISSVEENAVVQSLNVLKGNNLSVTIGLRYSAERNTWVWANEEPNGYRNWQRTVYAYYLQNGDGYSAYVDRTSGIAYEAGKWWYHEDANYLVRAFICEWESEWEYVHQQVKRVTTPAGYDFYKDSYSFGNTAKSISKKYFTTMFESGTAELIYKRRSGKGGNCFGIASTTACIYNGFPSIDRWNPSVNTIRGLKRSSDVDLYNGMHITLDDFIKYSHIFQFSVEAADFLWNMGGEPFAILNTVKQCTDDNIIGVVIGFYNLKSSPDAAGAHAVLAVGYEGNDILIDNPNNQGGYERLTINEDGSWDFGEYNSTTHVIAYYTNFLRPYQVLLTGNKVTADSFWYDDDGNEATGYCVEGMEPISADYTVASITGDSFEISSTDYLAIPRGAGDDIDYNDDNENLFWIRDSKTLTVSNIDDSPCEIEYAGDDTILGTKLTEESTATLTIDDLMKKAIIQTKHSEKVDLTLSTVDDEGNVYSIQIEGNANQSEVDAEKNELGVQITGLDNVTIEYVKNDEVVDSKDAAIKDGRQVTVSIDENNNQIVTDYSNDTSELPSNHENADPTPTVEGNKCKYCDTVHPNTFIGNITKFFHAVLYFFAHLFGKM